MFYCLRSISSHVWVLWVKGRSLDNLSFYSLSIYSLLPLISSAFTSGLLMKIIPIASSICSGRGFHHKEKPGFILENWVFNGGRQFSISGRGMWTFVMFTTGIIGYKQSRNSSINMEYFSIHLDWFGNYYSFYLKFLSLSSHDQYLYIL